MSLGICSIFPPRMRAVALAALLLLVAPCFALGLPIERNLIDKAGGMCIAGTEPTTLEATLNPTSPTSGTMDLFLFQLNLTNYNKDPIADGWIFVMTITGDPAVNAAYCKARTDVNGWAHVNYDPSYPPGACITYTYTYCPTPSDTPSLYECFLVPHPSGNGFMPVDFASIPCCDPAACPGVFNQPTKLPSQAKANYCNQRRSDVTDLCWPLMAILALLLGASFAAGHNPFGAFDFGTPRLSRGKMYQMRPKSMSFDVMSGLMAGIKVSGVKIPILSKGEKSGEVAKDDNGNLVMLDGKGKVTGNLVDGKGKAVTDIKDAVAVKSADGTRTVGRIGDSTRVQGSDVRKITSADGKKSFGEITDRGAGGMGYTVRHRMKWFGQGSSDLGSMAGEASAGLIRGAMKKIGLAGAGRSLGEGISSMFGTDKLASAQRNTRDWQQSRWRANLTNLAIGTGRVSGERRGGVGLKPGSATQSALGKMKKTGTMEFGKATVGGGGILSSKPRTPDLFGELPGASADRSLKLFARTGGSGGAMQLTPGNILVPIMYTFKILRGKAEMAFFADRNIGSLVVMEDRGMQARDALGNYVGTVNKNGMIVDGNGKIVGLAGKEGALVAVKINGVYVSGMIKGKELVGLDGNVIGRVDGNRVLDSAGIELGRIEKPTVTFGQFARDILPMYGKKWLENAFMTVVLYLLIRESLFASIGGRLKIGGSIGGFLKSGATNRIAKTIASVVYVDRNYQNMWLPPFVGDVFGAVKESLSTPADYANAGKKFNPAMIGTRANTSDAWEGGINRAEEKLKNEIERLTARLNSERGMTQKERERINAKIDALTKERLALPVREHFDMRNGEMLLVGKNALGQEVTRQVGEREFGRILSSIKAIARDDGRAAQSAGASADRAFKKWLYSADEEKLPQLERDMQDKYSKKADAETGYKAAEGAARIASQLGGESDSWLTNLFGARKSDVASLMEDASRAQQDEKFADKLHKKMVAERENSLSLLPEEERAAERKKINAEQKEWREMDAREKGASIASQITEGISAQLHILQGYRAGYGIVDAERMRGSDEGKSALSLLNKYPEYTLLTPNEFSAEIDNLRNEIGDIKPAMPNADKLIAEKSDRMQSLEAVGYFYLDEGHREQTGKRLNGEIGKLLEQRQEFLAQTAGPAVTAAQAKEARLELEKVEDQIEGKRALASTLQIVDAAYGVYGEPASPEERRQIAAMATGALGDTRGMTLGIANLITSQAAATEALWNNGLITSNQANVRLDESRDQVQDLVLGGHIFETYRSGAIGQMAENFSVVSSVLSDPALAHATGMERNVVRTLATDTYNWSTSGIAQTGDSSMRMGELGTASADVLAGFANCLGATAKHDFHPAGSEGIKIAQQNAERLEGLAKRVLAGEDGDWVVSKITSAAPSAEPAPVPTPDQSAFYLATAREIANMRQSAADGSLLFTDEEREWMERYSQSKDFTLKLKDESGPLHNVFLQLQSGGMGEGDAKLVAAELDESAKAVDKFASQHGIEFASDADRFSAYVVAAHRGAAGGVRIIENSLEPVPTPDGERYQLDVEKLAELARGKSGESYTMQHVLSAGLGALAVSSPAAPTEPAQPQEIETRVKMPSTLEYEVKAASLHAASDRTWFGEQRMEYDMATGDFRKGQEAGVAAMHVEIDSRRESLEGVASAADDIVKEIKSGKLKADDPAIGTAFGTLSDHQSTGFEIVIDESRQFAQRSESAYSMVLSSQPEKMADAFYDQFATQKNNPEYYLTWHAKIFKSIVGSGTAGMAGHGADFVQGPPQQQMLFDAIGVQPAAGEDAAAHFARQMAVVEIVSNPKTYYMPNGEELAPKIADYQVAHWKKHGKHDEHLADMLKRGEEVARAGSLQPLVPPESLSGSSSGYGKAVGEYITTMEEIEGREITEKERKDMINRERTKLNSALGTFEIRISPGAENLKMPKDVT